jgi:hypothetical protein
MTICAFMTDLRNDLAADHNRAYFDHSRAQRRCAPGAGCAHGAIAGSEATVILRGSQSVKMTHPASSTGSGWIPCRLNSHAGPAH